MAKRKKASRHKIPPYLLSLAGEYRVCSELTKRGMFATITYGNAKGVDVYAISDRKDRALRIEVKTVQGRRFLTGISQKSRKSGYVAPDFWVLVQMRTTDGQEFSERFFVLTNDEICRIQKANNRVYDEAYQTRHGAGRSFDIQEEGRTGPIHVQEGDRRRRSVDCSRPKYGQDARR